MDKQNLAFRQIIKDLLIPGRVSILGITGQAGAGKSTFIAPLALSVAREQGFAVAHLGLDIFFILSSRERKMWIQSGFQISTEEGRRREDQVNWWDFTRAQWAVNTLKEGRAIHLFGVYNREDGGELTGEVHVTPPSEGMLVVFEGVAILHLAGVDNFMYVHAPAPVRRDRLQKRDIWRTQEERARRFAVTQAFEQCYFPPLWERISCFVDNSEEYPQVLKGLSREAALAVALTL